MTTYAAFYKAGIVKDSEFRIMGRGRRSEFFRSLMEFRIELLELLWKCIRQFLCLGRREFLFHDIASTYFGAGFFY